MPDTPCTTRNRLLAALPAAERERLEPHLELVRLEFGAQLHEAGQSLRHVYFPTTAVICMMRFVENGNMAEVAVTGSEGVLGTAAFLGDGVSVSAALVKRGGNAFRLGVNALREEMQRHGRFERVLLRYAQSLIAQLVQTGVCNRLHNAEQRFCRCLLQLLDRQSSPRLEITHEFLSRILGIRRVGVTQLAGRLQAHGAISNGRGVIDVLDRALLEQRTCECYAIIENETARLAPPISA